MMEFTPFQMFGPQHMLTIFATFGIALIVPYYFKNSDEETKKIAGISISVIIAYQLITQAFTTFTFNLPWQEALPLHMCDMSAMAIMIYLFNRKKVFFNCAFFWGLGGASMAILTPDVLFEFPEQQYLPFFVIHGSILLGVFYACIVLNQRPFLADVHKVIFITIICMGIIYVLNLLLGEGANFWYLLKKPEAGSIMDVFPEPPFHLLITTPIGIVLFYLIYLPLLVKDLLAKRAA